MGERECPEESGLLPALEWLPGGGLRVRDRGGGVGRVCDRQALCAEQSEALLIGCESRCYKT